MATNETQTKPPEQFEPIEDESVPPPQPDST